MRVDEKHQYVVLRCADVACATGAATIRFQASPVDPLSFFDVKAAVQARTRLASLQAI